MKKEKKDWTVKEVLDWTADFLEQKGLPEPRLEAELLLAHVLGVKRLDLYCQAERPLTKKELQIFKVLVKRRLKREPIQYITQKAYIWKYDFYVEKGVFIPRKDTETLIEAAAYELKRKKGGFILDVGTGTGCILLSLCKDLSEKLDIKGVGTDVDPKALRLAKKNAAYLGVKDKVFFVRTDLFLGLKREIFDAVISNPPYVRSDEIDRLQDEISKYEPRIALNGGKDGLDVIRRIVKGAMDYLKPGGFLAVEVGAGQARAVKVLMERAGYIKIRTEKDLGGIERVVLGWKPC